MLQAKQADLRDKTENTTAFDFFSKKRKDCKKNKTHKHGTGSLLTHWKLDNDDDNRWRLEDWDV